MRTIANSHYRSHTGPLFAKNNPLNVTDMYTLELGVFMYKYSISDPPVAFKEYFMKRSAIHDYPTRHINNLNLTNAGNLFSTMLFELMARSFGTRFQKQSENLNL